MLFLFLPLLSSAWGLQTLPPVKWNRDGQAKFDINAVPNTIFLHRPFANVSDTQGLTLIPPTAREFAETFANDLSQLTRSNWTVEVVETYSREPGIYLGRMMNVVDGKVYFLNNSEEAYGIQISTRSISIGGTGARGMFWGTRTFLQELIIANGSAIPTGNMTDEPAYAARGFMLDAGRKWYDASFLKEMCTYASWFKMNEFHYHSSDNYPLNRGRNETWNQVYSQFSLMPEDPKLQGIVQRKNETLSRAEFEDFQEHCAQRGITVVPEIEAPGHCLSITKWKPELALAKKDLLNLTHPDAIPTVKALWAEFLPWFKTREVHIGADEYDPALADDYINFVNEMSDFIVETSDKRVRIWGTHEPSTNKSLVIDDRVIIQHWQYGQSDPIELQKDYQLINSEDWWGYMSLKNDHTPIFPATYPQFFNVTRTLNFANVPGWQWEPSRYNPVNISEQLRPDSTANKGAIIAAWNDNGPDATTQLEAYYAMRDGIPVAAARMWSGRSGQDISTADLDATLAALIPNVPGQNLDRRFPDSDTASSPLISWTGEESQANKTIDSAVTSYGPPYTLTLNVSGAFDLYGPDTTLSLHTNKYGFRGNNHTLEFKTNDNFIYPLRSVSPEDEYDPAHPGRIFTNVSTSTHELVGIAVPCDIRIETDYVGGSRVWVDGEFAGRFEVYVFGGRNTLFSWSQMAFVAPLESVAGAVDGLVLEKGATMSTEGTRNGTASPEKSKTGAAPREYWVGWWMYVAVGLVSFIVLRVV